MGKKKEDPPPAGAPGWMVTYGDMMSLLLCFFVMLVSMSSMEVEKFKAAAASLKGALSVLPYQDKVMPSPQIQTFSRGGKTPGKKRTQAVAQLKKMIKEKELNGIVKVTETSQGIHITIGDIALFDSGKDVLKSEIHPVLDGIVEIVATGTADENIRVEGHTDNMPIHNEQFNDNWELSIARAVSVIRYIHSKQSLDPRRLRPVGCGEYQPVDTNSTPEGRSRNRRVEIFIDQKNN